MKIKTPGGRLGHNGGSIFLYRYITTVMKKKLGLLKNPEETLSGTEKTLRDPEVGTESTDETLRDPQVCTEGTKEQKP